jgi:hypothetical protein
MPRLPAHESSVDGTYRAVPRCAAYPMLITKSCAAASSRFAARIDPAVGGGFSLGARRAYLAHEKQSKWDASRRNLDLGIDSS